MKVNLYSLKDKYIKNLTVHFHYILQLNNFEILMTRNKKYILIIYYNTIITAPYAYNHYICNITKKQLELLTSEDMTIIKIIFTSLIYEHEKV